MWNRSAHRSLGRMAGTLALMATLSLPGSILAGGSHGYGGSAEHVPLAKHHEEKGHEVESSGGKAHDHGESAAGHSHEMASRHGGQVVMTRDGTHVEFVFRPKSVLLYLYDSRQQPRSFQGASGRATVSVRGGGHHEVQLQHHKAREGGMDFLAGRFDFSKIAPGQARIKIFIKGVHGREEPLEATAKFKGLTGGHHGEAAAPEEHGHGSHGHESHDHGSHAHGSHGHGSHGHGSHGHGSHAHGSHGHGSHGHGSHGHGSHAHGAAKP